ncbi:hypothetical protein VTO42DRAFT_2181 [Malbranchea cinnamomea]
MSPINLSHVAKILDDRRCDLSSSALRLSRTRSWSKRNEDAIPSRKVESDRTRTPPRSPARRSSIKISGKEYLTLGFLHLSLSIRTELHGVPCSRQKKVCRAQVRPQIPSLSVTLQTQANRHRE